MTISTLTFQTTALAQMEALETALSQTQSQLSTGKQLQNAADNPTAMTQVNLLNAQLSASQQQVTNGNLVISGLQLQQNARCSFLSGSTASGARPFAACGSAVSYLGNDQVNQVQIGPDQSLSVGDAGSAVFMNIPAGNGTFTTAVAGANTGSASIDTGSVTNPAAWVPDVYTISFSTPTQYQVTNGSGAVVASGAYVSGNAIAFNGAQVTISGTPATGDQFTVAPAGKASVFSTISGLITTLNSGTLSSAQISTQMGGAIQQIDAALNNLNN